MEILQKDLETVYKWATDVNMEFNSDKFECFRVWPDPAQACWMEEHSYRAPDSKPITEKSHLRDLGVELDTNLTFEKHISNVTSQR